MSTSFDPYHRWLSIPPEDQPPDHYRLLGLKAGESDLDVVESAADRQMAHVRTFQSGKFAAESQRLLNEIAGAKLVLLDPRRKASYDAALRSKQPAKQAPVAQPVPAEPLARVPLPVVPGAPKPLRPIPVTSPAPQPVPAQSTLPKIQGPRVKSGRREQPFPMLVVAGVGVAALALAAVLIAANSPFERPIASRKATAEPAKDPIAAPRINPGPTPTHAQVSRPPTTPTTIKETTPVPPSSLAKSAEQPPTVAKSPAPAPTTKPSENSGPGTELAPRSMADLLSNVAPASTTRPITFGPKVPPPAKHIQEAKQKELAAHFQIGKSTTPEQKALLAALLWRTALELNEDQPAQFVLLNMVRDLAIENRNILLALDAVEALDRRFEYDAAAARALTVTQTLRGLTPEDLSPHLMTVSAGVADRLSAEQRCEDAEKIYNALGDALRRAKDQPSLATLAERRRPNDAIVIVFKNTKWAFGKLAQSPDDSGANHAVGKFLLLANQDLPRALSCLSKSHEPSLKAAAQLDVSQPADAMEQLELADRWWELAEKESNKEMRRRYQARAGGWYERAKPQLMGLLATKAEQRLGELKAANISPADVGSEKVSLERLSEGLLAHWKFDEGEGSIAGDSVGENKGTIKGAMWVDGIHGKALHFDGKNDSVLIGNNPALDFDGEITLAAWVRVTTLSPIQTNNEAHIGNIITHGYAYKLGREVRLTLEHTRDEGPIWDCAVWFGHGKGNSIRTIGPYLDHDSGNWIQVVATYDGSAWKMYRNAVLIAEKASKVGAMKLPENWAIGAHHTGSGRNFLGDIDEVRIYQRGLSAREVVDLYESTFASASLDR